MDSNSKDVTIIIDGQEVKAKEGETVLEVARKIGKDIPTLCYISKVSPAGMCRLCSVEVTDKHGRKRVVTSCNYPVSAGIAVETKSEKIIKIRRGILSLLMARCPKSVKLKNLGKEYGLQHHGLWEYNPDEDCILCGLCVRVCSELVGVYAINFAKRGAEREITSPHHTFSDDCIGCGVCAFVCPTGSKKIRTYTYATIAPLKGIYDETFGVNIDMFSAKPKAGQKSLVKALLAGGFKNKLFDTAVFVKRKNSCGAEAVIAQSADDIPSAEDAPFFRVKAMSKLLEAIHQGKRKIAFVGLPCQVRGVRKVQQTMQREIPDLDITSIGLFCKHAFAPQRLQAEIQRLFNVNIAEAEKTCRINNKFVVQMKGKEFSCELDKLDITIENGCVYCSDFSALFADVAFGSVGSGNGYFTVIVRTEKGAALIANTEFTKGILKKDALAVMSEFKKERAKAHIAPILEEIRAQRAGGKVE